MLKAYLNQQQEISHQEEVITKLKSFNREKSIKRAESREKMLDKIEVAGKTDRDQRRICTSRWSRVSSSGNDVLTVRRLGKVLRRHVPVFRMSDFEVKRGERVAIIGNNGTGKTTILKDHQRSCCRRITARSRLGSKVHIGYYDQEHQVLHMEKTLFEEISGRLPGSEQHADPQYPGRFPLHRRRCL